MGGANQPNTRHEQGMMLLELLTAVFIFVIAGSGIVGASISSHRLSQAAGHTMKAVSDLDDIAEGLRATPFNTVQGTFPSGVANGGGVTNYSALVGGYTLTNEQITVTYPSQSATRIEALITLNWTEQGRARTMQLSTVRTS